MFRKHILTRIKLTYNLSTVYFYPGVCVCVSKGAAEAWRRSNQEGRPRWMTVWGTQTVCWLRSHARVKCDKECVYHVVPG